jgi:hypothetical protein
MKSNPALLPISTLASGLAAMTGAGLNAPVGPWTPINSPHCLPDGGLLWKSVEGDLGAHAIFFSGCCNPSL